ncbi:dehydratase [Desulfatibacillum aliphaticivorans]|uniref:Dehydratase n=1 Tax=Desulfatibacillum aliphaticivorans TaxID=218208 RepID=B8F9B7_DESAL|nr:MaoC family dehydratase N-terminal domain-containing protein [Desulfatibacillum aliphaticivorans]ACL02863.1 dehydratase [Desulfatibacillum aliphaticivorans]
MIDKNMAGKSLGFFKFPVERGKIKEFVKATGNADPLHLDLEYAKNAGFGNVIMPLTFPGTFTFHMPSEDAVMDAMNELGMDPGRSVHGETEFIQHRPVLAGETLNVEMSVGNIDEKQGGRGGTMTFVEILLQFKDSSGLPALQMKNIFIEKSAI